MSTSEPGARPPVQASIPRIVVEGLAHRGELLGLELGEARTHFGVTLAFGGAGAALALLGGFAGTLAIAAAVWDRPDRGPILGLLTLAYFLAAAVAAWWTSQRLKTWRPLAETLFQLREDCTCLNNYLSENSR
jgi:uncharacterized membrane protein YqjE